MLNNNVRINVNTSKSLFPQINLLFRIKLEMMQNDLIRTKMLKQRCQNVLKKYFNLEILHRKTAFGSSCSNLGLNSLSII
jgi:hypothetical protein